MADYYNETSDTIITGTNSEDSIYSRGLNVIINALGSSDSVFNSNGSQVSINGGAGDDHVTNSGSDVLVDGGDGDDSIINIFTSGVSTVNTHDNVTIIGGKGNDSIYSYGDENISIDVGDGADYVYNDSANVTINAGDGNDTIRNGSGFPGGFVYSTGDFVSISGGNGNDYISSSGESVTIDGGKGNDTIENRYMALIKYKTGDGNDYIQGFNETSTLSISGNGYVTASVNDIIVNTDSGSIILEAARINTLKIISDNGLLDTSPALFAEGTDKADYISNALSNSTINALGGNDTIYNSGDSVTINAGDGNDSIRNDYSNSVTLNGGAGDDSIRNENSSQVSIAGGVGNDSIFNRANRVLVSGNEDNDSIENDSGSKVTINGDNGDDYIKNNGRKITINGGTGNDIIENESYGVKINAGTGDDSIFNNNDYANVTFKYAEGDGNDYISGFNSYSTLSISGVSSCSSVTVDNDIILTIGGGIITLKDAADLASIKVVFDSTQKLITLTESNDSYSNTVEGATIKALGGNDEIDNYGVENVTIDAGEGNDSISSSGDYSSIVGGTGNDYINNGNSNDDGDNVTIDSGAGDDSIRNHGWGSSIDSGDDNDTITNESSGANSIINAGAGADSIKNYGADVKISGGNGNDYVDNSGDNVIIDAGAGDDSISSSGNYSSIVGGTGNDKIDFYLTDKSIIFYTAGDGNDIIYNLESTDTSSNTLSISGASYSTTESGNDILVKVDNDTITLKNIYATADILQINNETIELEHKIIQLADGDDSIKILRDYLTIAGGKGNDSIENINSDGVSIDAREGNDSIYSQADSVTIVGGAGNDSIENRGSNNLVNGDAGNDFIYNWVSYNSSIRGGTGNDLISIGTPAEYDVIQYALGDGNDTIYGFKSNSSLQISGSEYSSAISGNDVILTIGSGSIHLINANDIRLKIDTVESFDNTSLTFDNNTSSTVELSSSQKIADASKRTKPIQITGNALDNSIIGGKGNDTLDGTKGNNTLTGGKGKDIFVHNEGNDTITDYEKGKDKVSLDSALISDFTVDNKNLILAFDDNTSLTLNGMADKQISFLNGSKTTKIRFTNNASLDGSEKGATLTSSATEFSMANYSKVVTINAESVSSAVSIIGNSKANKIIAGNNGSTLNGGKGNDTLIGGNGTDIFVYNNKSGNKVIQNYSSHDAISLVGAQITDAYVKSNDVILKAGNKKITVKDAASKDITIHEDGSTKFFSAGIIYDQDKTSAVITKKFSSKAEKVFDNTVTEIDASDARKKLALTSSNTTSTTIYGGRNKDALTGNSGNDIIYGGKGKDSLYGNAGDDSLIGDKGNDKLFGGTGADSLWGGTGNDTLYGDDGSDTFFYSKGDGKDVIFNFSDDDLLLVSGTFSAYYNSNKNEVSFKVASTSNAITLKNFSASSFNINGNSYKISGDNLIKK